MKSVHFKFKLFNYHLKLTFRFSIKFYV